ncbi:MAG: nucleotide kinase domain-containing protein [Patescibacteria group bacterium]
MELPKHIHKLYRHWPDHVVRVHSSEKPDLANLPVVKEICNFAHERLSIWQKKISNEPIPYTRDPILQKYRFCNVFREFDKQTIAFHTLLNPLRDDFALWLLNMLYCRMVARPETVESVGLLSFDLEVNRELYDRLMASSRPRYGTPYVFPISTIQKSATPNRERFICEYLPSIMKSIANEIETWRSISVIDGVKEILPMFGFNLNFLWTEVLIDVAYQYPERIDLFAAFPIGPGSIPTMRMVNRTADPVDLAVRLSLIPFDPGITIDGVPLRLSAENWEGIGCEFRKYTNLKSGRGRKRIYMMKSKTRS